MTLPAKRCWLRSTSPPFSQRLPTSIRSNSYFRAKSFTRSPNEFAGPDPPTLISNQRMAAADEPFGGLRNQAPEYKVLRNEELRSNDYSGDWQPRPRRDLYLVISRLCSNFASRGGGGSLGH